MLNYSWGGGLFVALNILLAFSSKNTFIYIQIKYYVNSVIRRPFIIILSHKIRENLSELHFHAFHCVNIELFQLSINVPLEVTILPSLFWMRGKLVSHEMVKAFDSLTIEEFSRGNPWIFSWFNPCPLMWYIEICQPPPLYFYAIDCQTFSDLSRDDKASES